MICQVQNPLCCGAEISLACLSTGGRLSRFLGSERINPFEYGKSYIYPKNIRQLLKFRSCCDIKKKRKFFYYTAQNPTFLGKRSNMPWRKI